MTPDGDFLDKAPIEHRTKQSLSNTRTILQKRTLCMDDVLNVPVFLNDIDDFGMARRAVR